MSKSNPLKKMGNINLWVNSRAYNIIENIHQIWLLSIVDKIIGKTEYSA
jgi:D-sedoheptulose 7-phosphate isomerase